MTRRHPLIRSLKAIGNGLALVAVLPAVLMCWLEGWLRGSEAVFWFWTHVLAIMPGLPGLYLRRAFYRLTLRQCSLNCWIDFGVIFAHRTASVDDEVYVGAYAVVGSVRLLQGCLIGTRASLLSGPAQHELRADGRWTPSGASSFSEIQIGRNAWIGEAAVVMADVGDGALVAAGTVVSTAVPPGVVVAGNPARFVRSTERAPSS
jgi:acetyltransferase-like isoleucine patch superfamily enzyme